MKRKKRTIEPRMQKPKNKKRKPTTGFVDEDESDEGEEDMYEVPEDNEKVANEIESAYDKVYGDIMGEDSETEDVDVEELLAGSEDD